MPREERAGHVSRPRPSPHRPSPDLDTPPRSSSATRSADGEFRWSATRSADAGSRWSSSAPRRRSRARVETSAKSPRTLARSRHASSSLRHAALVPRAATQYKSSSATRSAKLRSRWSSSAPRRRSRARVETSARSPGTFTGSRHASSFLVGYSISGCVGPAGRVVPRDEGAGHVSRPRPSPRRPSPDLDTPPRSSSATRSADGEFRHWPNSAP